jgi:hypothetical protein
MPAEYLVRLTAYGSAEELEPFKEDSNWTRQTAARFLDYLELSPDRFVCQFETALDPARFMPGFAALWPRITFLIEYEQEYVCKGTIRARDNQFTLFHTIV